MAKTFKDLFSRKSTPTGGTLTPTFFPLSWVNSFLSGYKGANDTKLLEYYLSVPELAAAINLKAELKSGMTIKLKRIDSGDIVEKHKVLDLMAQPNVLQDKTEFVKQASVFKDIFGNGYIHPIFGTSPSNTTALFNLPGLDAKVIPASNNLIPFNQTDINAIIKGYEFKFSGNTIKYEPNEVIHTNNAQVVSNSDSENYLKGISRIVALSQACENIRTAYEARGILQGNAPMGILSNKSKDGMGATITDPLEEARLQEDMKKYGLSAGKYKYILSGLDLGYVSMATNIGQLKLFEEVEADQLAIANAFGVPPELFLSKVTYDNKNEAKKQLYQDTIIPESNNWLSVISKGLELDKQGLILYADFSHVQVLQDDLEKRTKMQNTGSMAVERMVGAGLMTKEQAIDYLIRIGMIQN